MGWQDDDFADENTNPGAARPRPVQVPSQNQPVYPAQPPQQQQPQYPQQQPQYPRQQQPPQTGGFAAQPQQPAYPPQTGGFAQVPPTTGGYATGPSTGGFAAQGQGIPAPLSGSVPIIKAPVVAHEEEAKASRVVYGLSGTAVGGMMGVFLGVVNTVMEGQTITAGTEFIFESAIWFAFIVGALAFWKPERFDNAIRRLASSDDDEASE